MATIQVNLSHSRKYHHFYYVLFFFFFFSSIHKFFTVAVGGVVTMNSIALENNTNRVGYRVWVVHFSTIARTQRLTQSLEVNELATHWWFRLFCFFVAAATAIVSLFYSCFVFQIDCLRAQWTLALMLHYIVWCICVCESNYNGISNNITIFCALCTQKCLSLVLPPSSSIVN